MIDTNAPCYEDFLCCARPTTQAGGLPGKEENTAQRKKDRKDNAGFKRGNYKSSVLDKVYITGGYL